MQPQNPQQIKQFNPPNQLEEVRIKRLGVLSVALTCTLLNLIIGFIVGVITLISFLFMVNPLTIQDRVLGLVPASSLILLEGTGTYLTTLIIIPLISAILGFIFGAILAVFYNLFSKLTKGIKLYA
ncbi:MAG: hypothetical protein KKA64_03330 [Nanoarchaeota archaeon]|nr:hypothetical protein [Nanoarchaeota archaeon]